MSGQKFGFYNFSVVSKLYTKGEGPDSQATNGDETDPDGEPISDEEPQRTLWHHYCKCSRKNAAISRDVDQACEL